MPTVLKKMMDTILLLDLLFRQRPPDIPRDRPFPTIHTDDEDLAFRTNKRREIPVQNFTQ
jgi:hypothetical protein